MNRSTDKAKKKNAVSRLVLEEKLANVIGASVIANWRHDMGDGNSGFNSLAVAHEVLNALGYPAAPSKKG